MYTDANGLERLKENDCYKNIPTMEELRSILAQKAANTKESMQGTKDFTWRDLQAEPQTQGAQTGDPLAQPLELVEYWSDDRVITVLQGVIVIRNEQHEFPVKPFVTCAFIDVIGSAYGFGVAKLLSGEQRFQAGVINTWIDQLALILNPVFQTKKGLASGAQNVKFS